MGLKELFQSSAVVLKKDYFQGKYVVLIITYLLDLTKEYQCEADCHDKQVISYKRLFFEFSLYLLFSCQIITRNLNYKNIWQKRELRYCTS